jgi:esterase/lipase
MYNGIMRQVERILLGGYRLMEWAIALLFAAAVVLLILSFSKNNQQSKSFEKQLEETTFTYMEEINKLQEQMRNMELDVEIIAVQAGFMNGSGEQHILYREILDLYKRGYSAESIALKKQLSVDEIEQLLSPFKQLSNEGSYGADDI